jgi:phage terminase small subunit
VSEGKRRVDWDRIEQDYREGVSTLREIAARHDVTHGAINKRAKRDGWTRSTVAKVIPKNPKVSKKVSKQVSKTGIHESLDTSVDTKSVSVSDELSDVSGSHSDDEKDLADSSTLTPKQKLFVEEYLIDLNATQAAIRAKYSVKSASDIGRELLRKTPVADAIAIAMAERSARVNITQDRVLRELAAMAYYDPADLGNERIEKPSDIAKLPEHVRRAIIGWSWDKHGNFVLKLASKTPNLELIGRHQSMFKDRLDVKNENAAAPGPDHEMTLEEMVEEAKRRGLPIPTFADE